MLSIMVIIVIWLSQVVRKKYSGEGLEAFKQILRDHRLVSPATKVQVWGRNPMKCCLLFQVDRTPASYRSTVKEIFFVPYRPPCTLWSLKNWITNLSLLISWFRGVVSLITSTTLLWNLFLSAIVPSGRNFRSAQNVKTCVAFSE